MGKKNAQIFWVVSMSVTDPYVLCLDVSLQVYINYPEDLGAALYREPFDFNAEPPWDPS